MNKEFIIKRFKNPYFWFAIIATIISASSIEAKDITTWAILQSKLLGIVLNPYKLGLVIVALIGIWNNPTTNSKKLTIDK